MVCTGDGDLSDWRLRQAQEARGYTQLRLAAEIGVSRQSISGLEAGRYPPNVATLHPGMKRPS